MASSRKPEGSPNHAKDGSFAPGNTLGFSRATDRAPLDKLPLSLRLWEGDREVLTNTDAAWQDDLRDLIHEYISRI